MVDSLPLIDVNVTLGRWPTRRMPCDELSTLAAKLKSHNIGEAWVGSFDGLFHDDLTAVNDRLAHACRAQNSARFRPFGSINPLDTDWQSELRRCANTHRMPGVRLHPNYHGYLLNNPNFLQLLQRAAELKVVVQLVTSMEDSRMMHPLMRVPPVDLTPLAKVLPQAPGLKLVLLNSLTTADRSDKVYRLLEAGDVYVDIATLEGAGGIESLLKDVPAERVMFGSHAPSFYVESAVLKLKESHLSQNHRTSITNETASKLLPAVVSK